MYCWREVEKERWKEWKTEKGRNRKTETVISSPKDKNPLSSYISMGMSTNQSVVDKSRYFNSTTTRFHTEKMCNPFMQKSWNQPALHFLNPNDGGAGDNVDGDDENNDDDNTLCDI